MVQTLGSCVDHSEYNAECIACLDAKPVLKEALDMRQVIEFVSLAQKPMMYLDNEPALIEALIEAVDSGKWQQDGIAMRAAVRPDYAESVWS